MDGKGKITLDFAQEECIDLSIGYTPACSIYLLLSKGLLQVKHDIDSMQEYILNIKDKALVTMTNQERDTLVKKVEMEMQVAKLAYENGKKFIAELARVIQELEPTENKPKIHIPKPNWNNS